MNKNKSNASFCQSCSMPMQSIDDFGTNPDGSKNEEYCHFCYQNGRFTEPNITMEEMITKCTGIMNQMHIGTLIEQTKMVIPNLKRWKK